MVRGLASILSFAAVLALLSTNAAAQPTLGHEFRVNSYTTDDQTLPSVSVNSRTGEFIVAWKDGGFHDSVTAPVFDAAGTLLFTITDSGPVTGGLAASALAPGGEVLFFVNNNTASGTIYGLRNTDSLSSFVVNTYATGVRGLVRVASDANGNFVVVWSNQGEDGSGYGIFARRYLYSGEPVGFLPEFRVNAATAGDQKAPSVARGGAGDFVVVWQTSVLPGACCAQIVARRFDSLGTPQGVEFPVDLRADVGNFLPDVAADTAGNFVVVWTSYNAYGNYSYNVHARRYSSSGVALGGPFRVNSYTVGVAQSPRVARGERDFLVVWEEQQADGSGFAVLGHRYAPDGSSLGGTFHVNTHTTGNQAAPAIAARPGGPYVVVWTDDREGGGKHDVYAQRYCVNGDANGDGSVGVADVFYLISSLFAGGPPPAGCADVNGNGVIDVADVFSLINFLFAGGPAPVQ